MAAKGARTCGTCEGRIDKSEKAYTCVCGMLYHGAHASSGTCVKCGADFPSIPTEENRGTSIRCPTCDETERIDADANPAIWKCGTCGVILKEIPRKYNYLIICEEPHLAYDWFVSVVRKGVPGLCLSTAFPGKLRREYGLQELEQYWLSDTAGGPGNLNPRRLEFEIMRAFANFLKANKGGAMILDGLENLVVENSFDKVFKFIKKVTDLASVYEGTLIVPLAPKSLETDQLARLRKEFDKVEVIETVE